MRLEGCQAEKLEVKILSSLEMPSVSPEEPVEIPSAFPEEPIVFSIFEEKTKIEMIF